MLSSMLMTTALAAAVLANPMQHFEKRDVVHVAGPTHWVTEVVATVTVWDNAASPSDQPASKDVAADNAPVPQVQNKESNWGNGGGFRHRVQADNQASSAPEPSSSPEQQAQAQAPPSSSTVQQVKQVQAQNQAPSSTAAQASAEAPASNPASPAPSDYKSQVVWHHNVHRANHSVANVEWSDALAATAQKIGQSCMYAHNTKIDQSDYPAPGYGLGPGYGQNIAAGVKADNVSSVITEQFYNGEVRAYVDADNYGKPNATMDHSNFDTWGHFTQMVWSNTTQVGCATVDCTVKGLGNTDTHDPDVKIPPYFTVCNYYPAGNTPDYQYNVFPGKGGIDSTVYWNSS